MFIIVLRKYFFPSTFQLVVIGSFGPCFLTSTNLTYLEIIDILDARNGSSATTNAQFSLDGTALPLPFEQVRQLFDTYPSLRRACRDGRVIVTTPGQETPVPFPTEELSVLAVDAEISIRISPAPRPTTTPHRRIRQPWPEQVRAQAQTHRLSRWRSADHRLSNDWTGRHHNRRTAGPTTVYPSP
ncbi:hypothetical protein Btru_002485 [Bulinus truncatus]|nr:hypothetical protein Btru_002485 [Bulinus truncatus]